MRVPRLIRRPGENEVSAEKAGAGAVLASSLSALAMWLGHRLWPEIVPPLVRDDMVMPMLTAAALAMVQIRARNRRGER